MKEVQWQIDDFAYVKGYHLTPYAKLGQERYPTVLIVPGGGFNQIPEIEAERMCLAFLNEGYNAYYVRYHLYEDGPQPLMPQPLIDVAKAVKILREHNDACCGNGRLIMAGFSIGGELVTQYNGRYHESWLCQTVDATADILRPNQIILGYPVTNFDEGFPKTDDVLQKMTDAKDIYRSDTYIGEHCAPVFMWTTWDDNVVDALNTLSYARALHDRGIDAEVHVFDHGPHGMALSNHQTSAEPDVHLAHWFELCLEWLERQA